MACPAVKESRQKDPPTSKIATPCQTLDRYLVLININYTVFFLNILNILLVILISIRI